jgi:hypothetical protein
MARWLSGVLSGMGPLAGLALTWLLAAGPLRAESPTTADPDASGLIGYWKLRGDCRDYSGLDNHGVNHGVRLDDATFDGRGAYIEVPHHPSLRLATGDFTIGAWVWTANEVDDVIGDVIEKYDPDRRRGFTLSLHASAGGYQSQGNDRHVSFGIDNGHTSDWTDCGRPSLTSNYVSNSLTVYRGHLYAATTDAQDERDWCHVFRYDGDQRWIDCGRVGNARTTGVGPMIVHNDELYAVTWTYDWTRVGSGQYDPGRVYRYLGGQQWQDCGQPGGNRTWNCIASFQGKLYVGGGPETWGVFVRDEDHQWRVSKQFSKTGTTRCFPHAMCRYNGKLYTAYPGVHAFDGEQWTFAGVPAPPVATLQTHSLQVYQGKLCAGTWPDGKVSQFLGGEQWQSLGRVGEDGSEVNALVVYNGKLYGGSIPRAEVCRYDGREQWTSLKRFYSPDGWQPAPPSQVGGEPTREQVNEWSRVTSLTIFDGQLFASIGSCTSSIQDAPSDVRGRVFRMHVGRCATYDDDLGPGWKYLTAVREQGRLKLYVDGRRVAESQPLDPADYDLSSDRPLRIGMGQIDSFAGKISEVRLYARALSEAEIERLAASHRP